MNKTELKHLFESFKKQHIIVIGDLIIDEYRFCEALGKSSEAPVLVVREETRERYIGGAGVVAKHVIGLGAKCTFITCAGRDSLGHQIREEIKDFSEVVFFDDNRSTTFKKRYLVDNYKLLRVSKLKEDYVSANIEKHLIKSLEETIERSPVDAIIVSDFNYGVITKNVLEAIRKLSFMNNIHLFGDTQSSSQIGNVNQFNNYDLITPNEREARIALKDEHSDFETLGKKILDKTFAKNVCLTLGKRGFITFSKSENKFKEYPTLNNAPVDAVGAGDALLAAFALAYGEINIWDASLFAQHMAGLKVSKVGNKPITADELQKEMEKSL